jgi:hypothetical protein
MAERSGAGGAFGWLLLGLLGGVALTLGVETLMYGHGHRSVSNDDSVAVAVPRMSVPLPAPVTPVMKPVHDVKAADPSRAYQAPQPEGQVEDDAAAAGMTTRSTHSQDSEPR